MIERTKIIMVDTNVWVDLYVPGRPLREASISACWSHSLLANQRSAVAEPTAVACSCMLSMKSHACEDMAFA